MRIFSSTDCVACLKSENSRFSIATVVWAMSIIRIARSQDSMILNCLGYVNVYLQQVFSGFQTFPLGASGGVRTCHRGVHAGLKTGSLSNTPPTPPYDFKELQTILPTAF
ncbi:hypothetical protein PoB_000134300 [Plakobranchus ocellatus]|uniref:Uncharacterized protein n=1 Tax=Plakobranchus ocellatus TaxID=259542 RepID=A0AAV3XWU1_9GAST|nr:hypothetical protein PoB_000134300 [Plakobranchus ocellatus]